jgi:hypothetical protein
MSHLLHVDIIPNKDKVTNHKQASLKTPKNIRNKIWRIF